MSRDRRLDAIERELSGGEPRVEFTIHVPPLGLSAAEHAAYVQARGAFTLNLGHCRLEDEPR